MIKVPEVLHNVFNIPATPQKNVKSSKKMLEKNTCLIIIIIIIIITITIIITKKFTFWAARNISIHFTRVAPHNQRE